MPVDRGPHYPYGSLSMRGAYVTCIAYSKVATGLREEGREGKKEEGTEGQAPDGGYGEDVAGREMDHTKGK